MTNLTAPALLLELLALDSPAGDEGPLADWLEDWLAREVPDARVERLGDALLAVRGERPAVAVFAHTDTTGWTQGYDKTLVRIGGPDGKAGDGIRPALGADTGHVLAPRKDDERGWRIKGKVDTEPGTRWVYAAWPEVKHGEVRGPYLDNRGGLWAALLALKACPNIAVALTTGEEVGGPGAMVCARRLWEAHGITQALISDLTWHTKYIKRGRGPAVSLPGHEAELVLVSHQASPETLRALVSLLTDDERAAAERHRMPAACDRAIVSRAALRLLLSRHAGVAPHALDILAEPNGKPFVRNRDAAGGATAFNL